MSATSVVAKSDVTNQQSNFSEKLGLIRGRLSCYVTSKCVITQLNETGVMYHAVIVFDAVLGSDIRRTRH